MGPQGVRGSVNGGVQARVLGKRDTATSPRLIFDATQCFVDRWVPNKLLREGKYWTGLGSR